MSFDQSRIVTHVAVITMALWGCGGGDNLATEKPVNSVSVTPTTSTITPGGTVQLQAVTQDADGTTVTSREIAWSSSDNTVAATSSTGLVTGVAPGSATITATSEGKSGVTEITVQNPVATVSVQPGEGALAPSETIQLVASLEDAEHHAITGRSIAWSASNTTVATVSQNGLVTAVDDGVTTITATAEGQSGSAVITVATGPLQFVSVSAGFVHSCGLTRSGKGYCWGSNRGGQLGDDSARNSSTPVAVAGGLTFSTIAAGYLNTCGLTTTGAVYCWGMNDWGQLGTGSVDGPESCLPDGEHGQQCSTVPLAVSGGLSFASVVVGGIHVCGLTTNGAVYCWGFARSLGSGNGELGDSWIPVAVSGGLTFTTISASGVGYPPGHTCGLTASGAAHCWGYNEFGELGDGSNEDRMAPVAVTGGLTFSRVAAGAGHSCGIATSGATYCWGANGHGQLGNGTHTYVSSPVTVAGGLAFSALTSGGLHSCGLTSTGKAYCWGENEVGQLGDGSITSSSVPVAVVGSLRFSSVSAGTYHTCGTTSSGELYCWGWNFEGQLGDGSTTNTVVPVLVAGQQAAAHATMITLPKLPQSLSRRLIP